MEFGRNGKGLCGKRAKWSLGEMRKLGEMASGRNEKWAKMKLGETAKGQDRYWAEWGRAEKEWAKRENLGKMGMGELGWGKLGINHLNNIVLGRRPLCT